MIVFQVRGGLGGQLLEFHERTPPDPRRPIERFKVRLAQADLSADARVYLAETEHHPGRFFDQMASNWRGWTGELSWESVDAALCLRAQQDRAGHVLIRITLSSGSSDADWTVHASLAAEAGQLDALAREAASFFGMASERAITPADRCQPTSAT